MADITDGTSNTYLVGEKYMDVDYYETGQDMATTKGCIRVSPTTLPVTRGREAAGLPMQDTPGWSTRACSARPTPTCSSWPSATAPSTASAIPSP